MLATRERDHLKAWCFVSQRIQHGHPTVTGLIWFHFQPTRIIRLRNVQQSGKVIINTNIWALIYTVFHKKTPP